MSVVALSSVRQDLILLSDRRLMLQDLQMFLICSSMLNPLSSTAPILRTDELPENYGITNGNIDVRCDLLELCWLANDHKFSFSIV